jgi:plastocyanin
MKPTRMKAALSGRLLPLGAGVFFLALCVAAYASSVPKTVVVTRTAEGFKPSQILIRQGDSVRFVSDMQQDFWPASSPHPTHTLYQGFDPGRPLRAGESWTFTFDRAGSWSYHDHLHPNAVGIILVIGAPGADVQSCISANPNATSKSLCWAPSLTDILQRKGLDAAFDAIKEWNETDPVFRSNCHDVMHILGARAYLEFEQDHTIITREETAYCAFGFYHGFIEQMLVEEGPEHYDKAREYCEAIARSDNTGARGPCYHGIGHAVFDSLDSSLWGNDAAMVASAIGTCERVLSGEYERARCASGVYNALSNAYSARTYGLSFSDAEPIPICPAQKKAYQPFCYMELGTGYLFDKQWDTAAQLAFIRSISDADARNAIITGYMDTRMQRDPEAADELAPLCERFVADGGGYACIQGILIGFGHENDPQVAQERTDAFCAKLTDPVLRSSCTPPQ